ncbi:ECF transporter S component [Enterococcus sp. LJL99]
MKNSKKPQKNFFSIKEIAYLSMLTAACVVGRTLFQFIPNVQPMTVIFLLITFYLGLSRGLVVALLSILITNMYMGMGVWTFSQLVSYTIVLYVFYLLCKLPLFRRSFWLKGLYCVFAGLLYGFIISVISVKVYGMTAFLPYYLSGVYFDFMHGLGNGGFYLVLAPIFAKLLPVTAEKR